MVTFTSLKLLAPIFVRTVFKIVINISAFAHSSHSFFFTACRTRPNIILDMFQVTI